MTPIAQNKKVLKNFKPKLAVFSVSWEDMSGRLKILRGVNVENNDVVSHKEAAQPVTESAINDL